MTKRRSRDIGAEILMGIQQLKRGEVGRVVTFPSVSETRARVGLSQSEFAWILGVSIRTLQEWEQGRGVPSGDEVAEAQAALIAELPTISDWKAGEVR